MCVCVLGATCPHQWFSEQVYGGEAGCPEATQMSGLGAGRAVADYTGPQHQAGTRLTATVSHSHSLTP